ncbi:MAG: ATP-binding protein [bacterium]
MKIKRKIIEINEDLCDGCGRCVPACAEGAIQVIDGKATLVAEKYCDGLGACLGECPKGALKIIEREAEDFDVEAVEEYLGQKEEEEETSLPCGCPSTHVKSFGKPTSCQEMKRPVTQSSTVSALTHWPVQIRLVPPTAPFLTGAELLVLSDCAAVAYPELHHGFLKNRAVMMGCPKFDDAQEYVQKFSAVFTKADIKKITILMMEVPCCSGLAGIIEKAMAAAGKKIPVEKIILSTRGEIL